MRQTRRIKPMLTADDVSHLLGVHVNTVRRWTDKGIIKTYRIGPRGDRRFIKEDINRFLVEQVEEGKKSVPYII